MSHGEAPVSLNPTDRVGAEVACFEGRYDDNCARAGTGICEQEFGDDEQCAEVCERLSTEWLCAKALS